MSTRQIRPSIGVRALPGILVVLAGTASTVRAGVFPSTVDLSTVLNGTDGFVCNGTGSFDNCGISVAGAGDVNADGFMDLIIGASLADPAGLSSAGKSYIVFGGPSVGGSGSLELSSLNGTNGFVCNGVATSDQSGISVDAAGDINGDGIDDLIIGARYADPNAILQAGTSYIVFGSPTLGASGSLELSSLNGTNGFAINGVDALDNSGFSVAGAGDINGDTIADLLISAHTADPNATNAAGETYVVFGGPSVGASGSLNLATLNGTNGFVINGIDASDNSGFSVSGASDVNGDGMDDLIIGARYADPNALANAGESYIVFGGPGVGASGSLNLSALNGANGFVLNGIDVGDTSAFSVSGAGDVNADGFADVIIGARNGDPNGQSSAGECYIVFGGASVGASGSLNLSTLNGANGFILNGIANGDFCGQSVSDARDPNGDGFADVIVGAPAADPNGNLGAGESYIVYGGPAVGAGGIVNASALNGTTGFALRGIVAGDQIGILVASPGDVNGDGVDDLIIGANGADPNAQPSAGAAYIVFGRTSNIWSSTSGGSWDNGAKWLGGVAPTRGPAIIDTHFGVTVSGPADTATLKHLTLGAAIGRTTLDLLAFSLVSISDPLDIPASGAITGSGVLVADAGITNNGLLAPDDLVVVSNAGITNDATLDCTALGSSAPPATLTCFGAIANSETGHLILHGPASISADAITNSGDADIAFADATIDAPYTNAGTPNGPGFDPLGLTTISGGSEVLFTTDLINQSDIVLTTDSSIVILGELSGNGVSGPGGGPAGTVFAKGGVSPGFLLQTGIASFGGALNLGAANLTTIEIGGTTPGAGATGHDQVATLGTLAAGGTLHVNTINGYIPLPGDAYHILDFASVSGSFASVVLDAVLVSASADASTLLIDGTIRIPAPSCAGDINGDGFTNSSDFNILASNFGSAVAPNTNGDLTGDGIVNSSDFNVLAGDFGCGS